MPTLHELSFKKKDDVDALSCALVETLSRHIESEDLRDYTVTVRFVGRKINLGIHISKLTSTATSVEIKGEENVEQQSGVNSQKVRMGTYWPQSDGD